jgi:signal transduction histidine kinase
MGALDEPLTTTQIRVSTIPTPLMRVDSNHELMEFNSAMAELARRCGLRLEPGAPVEHFWSECPEALASGLSSASGRFDIESVQLGEAGTCYVTIDAVPTDGGGYWLYFNDTTARVEATRELAAKADEIAYTNELLRTVNSELEEVVYAASHDLRGPLVNLHALIRKLENAAHRAARRAGAAAEASADAELAAVLAHDIPRILDRMDRTAVKADAVIDGLQRLSRTGRQVLDSKPLDMTALVARVVDQFAMSIEQHKVRLLVGDLPHCHADPDGINVVMANLLQNALNYLDPSRSGEIIIEGTRDGSMCRYAIRDNGVGIAAADRDRVFTLFERLRPEQCGGDGLGLAIVRKIVRRHGGVIDVDSERGEGSTFWFTLPSTACGQEQGL